jgi:hypothetical protein
MRCTIATEYFEVGVAESAKSGSTAPVLVFSRARASRCRLCVSLPGRVGRIAPAVAR